MKMAAIPLPVRPRWYRHAALLGFIVPIFASNHASGADPSVVACYDETRKIVSHTLPDLCTGEVISPEREAALAQERRLRIQTTVQTRTADPVTGTHRLYGTGSGFFIGRNGELLTNDHVINHCDMLTATPDDGAKLPMKLIATDPAHDIALLRADVTPPGIASFSGAPERSDGNHLAVVGYPAYGLPTRLSSLASAQIDPQHLATLRDRIEFNGEVRHGNSGSPLLDEAGNVLGVVNATIDTPKVFKATGKRITNIGIAISYTAVMRFLALHSVQPILATGPQPTLDPEALHEKSRHFVAQVGCWK
jgi:S1-C subfamily serine protease